MVNVRKSRKMFREFCKEHNLRYKLDECGNPISPTRSRKLKDHLYWMGDDQLVGVFVERDSESKYKTLKKKLLKLGCQCSQDGDTEGTFLVNLEKALPIAELLATKKNAYSEEKRKAARERMRKLWKEGKIKGKKG